MTTFDDIAALDAEHGMQTYGRLPVAFDCVPAALSLVVPPEVLP